MNSWVIKQIKAKNIFRYASLGINFPSEKMTCLVSGVNLDSEGTNSNGSGKSSIFDIFAWCVFGKTARTERNKKVVRRETVIDGKASEDVYAEVTLTNGAYDIVIRRELNKNFGSSLTFISFYGGEEQDLTKRNPTLTQLAINKFFSLDSKRGFEDFLSSVYFSDVSSKGFLSDDITPKERQRVLERFLGLGVFDKAIKQSKLKSDEFERELFESNTEYNSLSSITDNVNIDEANKELKEIEKLVSNVELEISSNKEKFDQANESLRTYGNYSKAIENLIEKEDSIVNSKNKLIKQYKELKHELADSEEKRKRWKASENRYNELKEKISGVKDKIISLNEAKSKIPSGNEIHVEKNKYVLKRTELEDTLHDSMKCPSCNADLMKIDKQLKPLDREKALMKATEYKEKISQLDTLLRSLEEQRHDVQETIQEFNNVRNEYEREFNKLAKLKAEVDNSDLGSLDALVEKGKELENKHNEIKTEIELNKGYLNNFVNTFRQTYPEYKLPHQLVEFIKGNISELQDNLIELKTNVAIIKNKIKTFEENSDKLKQLKKDIKVIKNDLNISKYWELAFDDIKRHMLNSFIPLFEKTVNEHLTILGVNERVRFDLLKESDSGNTSAGFNIQVFDGKTWDDYGAYSGGERSRILVSAGFALRELASKKIQGTFGFLLCDELLDNLDETGRLYFFKMIKNISGQKFIITHSDTNSIQENCTHELLVTREDNVSRCEIKFL